MNPPNAPPTGQTPSGTPPPPSEFDAGIDALEGTDNPSIAAIDSPPSGSSNPDPQPSSGDGTPPGSPGTQTDGNAKVDLGDDLQPFLKKPDNAPTKPQDGQHTPRALREDHARLKTDLEAKSKRISELEAEIEKAKTSATESVRKELDAKLKALEEQYAKAEEKLQAADYRLSEDYQKRYVEPETKAWEEAARILSNVKIETEDGTERNVTDADVIALARMDPRQAFEAATKMGQFGPLVLEHAKVIRDLQAKRTAAVSEHAKLAQERRKAESEGRESARKSWESNVEEIITGSKDTLGLKADDPEMAQLVTAGDKLARMAMLGEVGDGVENPREVILKAQALAGVRIKTFGAVFLRAQRAEKRIAELEAKLKEFEGGEPGIGGDNIPSGEHGSGGSRNPEDGIDDIPGYDSPV